MLNEETGVNPKLVPDSNYFGESITRVYTQDQNQENYVSVENITQTWEFRNISENSTTDLLRTQTEIKDGDELTIVPSNNTPQQLIASGVVFNDPYYEVNTSSVTNGEIPTYSFLTGTKLQYGNQDNIIPNKICDFQASDNENYQITCTWSDSLGIPEPTYNLYNVDSNTLIIENITPPYTWERPDITDDTTYTLRVDAVNPEGVVSSNTDTGIAKYGTAPGPILDFDASDDLQNGVRVTFTPSSGEPTPSHDLYENDNLVATEITSGYFRSVGYGTRTYYVKAHNIIDESISNSDNGTSLVIPSAPSSLSATNGTYDDQIRISWSDIIEAEYYELYRDGTKLREENDTYYYDYDIVSNVTYTYKVKACNALGCSGYSPSDDGYAALPEPPEPLTITASDGDYDDYVLIDWETGSNGADYVEIYRDGQLIGTEDTWWDWEDHTALPGVLYTYYVKGCMNAEPPQCSTSNSDTGYRGTLIDPPTNVQATDGTYSDRIVITWTPADGMTSDDRYFVYRDDIEIGYTGGTVTSFTDSDSNLVPEQLYTYMVKSFVDEEFSAPSNSDTGYVGADPFIDPITLSIDTTPPGEDCGKFMITFNEDPDATQYDLLYEDGRVFAYDVSSGNILNCSATSVISMFVRGYNDLYTVDSNVVDWTCNNCQDPPGSVTYTSSGTFIVPNGYSSVFVQMIGGGGSGSRDRGGGVVAGGGFAGSEWCGDQLVTSGASMTVTVGVGGTSKQSYEVEEGNDGTSSSFGGFSASGGSGGYPGYGSGGYLGVGNTNPNQCLGTSPTDGAYWNGKYGGEAGWGNGSNGAGVTGGTGAGGGAVESEPVSYPSGPGGRGEVRISWGSLEYTKENSILDALMTEDEITLNRYIKINEPYERWRKKADRVIKDMEDLGEEWRCYKNATPERIQEIEDRIRWLPSFKI